jgi:hypothetical protein
MEDIFMERIVRRKKDVMHYLKATMVIATAFLLASVLTMVVSRITMISFLLPLLLAGCGYGAWWLITSLDLEFEYIVTNGEIDIDSIVHKRRRKRVFSGRSKDFEIMARLDSDEFREASDRMAKDRRSKSIRILDCSAVPGRGTNWYFIANYKSNRLLVVFDPDERMLVNMKRFSPSKVKYNPMIHG